MSKQGNSSTQQSSQPINSWEERLKRLDERLRAFGLTEVEIQQPTDTRQFVATFHNPSKIPSPSTAKTPSEKQFKGLIDWEEALVIVAKNITGRVIQNTEKKALNALLAVNENATADEILAVAPGLALVLDNLEQDKYRSYCCLTDHEGGSECGPWPTTLYDVFGIWIVTSSERDTKWLDNEDDAWSELYRMCNDITVSERYYKSKYRSDLEKIAAKSR